MAQRARLAQGPSSTTRSRRARPSTTTNWSNAGRTRAEARVPSAWTRRPGCAPRTSGTFRGVSMTLELRNIVKRVGLRHPHSRYVFDAAGEGGFNILLGTTLSGKTTLMQLMAGTGAADVRRGVVQRRKCHRRRGAQAQWWPWCISSSSTIPHLSVFENIASPLRVAGVRGGDVEETGQHRSPISLS